MLDIAASHVRPGVTTDFIDEAVHRATIERNAYPSPLNYRGFPKSVCTCVLSLCPRPCLAHTHARSLSLFKSYAHRSVNEVICHGIPDQRPLQEGDIINIGVSFFSFLHSLCRLKLTFTPPTDVSLYYDGT